MSLKRLRKFPEVATLSNSLLKLTGNLQNFVCFFKLNSLIELNIV